MTYEIHPAALLFPMMTDQEIASLAEDIRTNGLMEPIALCQGQIIDGRNRQLACEIAGLPPRFVDVSGDASSPTVYVVSKNLHRRHLTISQRAIIAAEMIPMLEEAAHGRQVNLLKNQTHISSVPTGTDENVPGRSRKIAARELQVGQTSVTRALRTKRENPEAFERAKRGEISVYEASGERDERHRAEPMQNPGDPQQKRTGVRAYKKEPYDPISPKQIQQANREKARITQVLASIDGSLMILRNIDYPMVASVCQTKEIHQLMTSYRMIATNLKQIAQGLEEGLKINATRQIKDS